MRSLSGVSTTNHRRRGCSSSLTSAALIVYKSHAILILCDLMRSIPLAPPSSSSIDPTARRPSPLPSPRADRGRLRHLSTPPSSRTSFSHPMPPSARRMGAPCCYSDVCPRAVACRSRDVDPPRPFPCFVAFFACFHPFHFCDCTVVLLSCRGYFAQGGTAKERALFLFEHVSPPAQSPVAPCHVQPAAANAYRLSRNRRDGCTRPLSAPPHSFCFLPPCPLRLA